jgi:hypothetical protein
MRRATSKLYTYGKSFRLDSKGSKGLGPSFSFASGGLDGLTRSSSLTLGGQHLNCIPMGSHSGSIRRAQKDLDHLLALHRGDWTVLHALVR